MSTTSSRPRTRVVLAIALAASAVLTLSACKPEPAASAAPAPTIASASASPTLATPTPTPLPTAQPAGDIVLPGSCESLYSPAMTATLQQNVSPLNDAGVTMFSSQNVDALDVLSSGVPTLRCSWGTPSEKGIATNVTIIAPAQAATIRQSMLAAGFACEDTHGAVLCLTEATGVDQDDRVFTRGEMHYFRGNGWIATSWLEYIPEGYTQDIADVLWG